MTSNPYEELLNRLDNLVVNAPFGRRSPHKPLPCAGEVHENQVTVSISDSLSEVAIVHALTLLKTVTQAAWVAEGAERSSRR